MDYALLGSSITVISFVTFAAIVAWALSRRRASAFAQAAQAPFALRDESEGDGQGKTS